MFGREKPCFGHAKPWLGVPNHGLGYRNHGLGFDVLPSGEIMVKQEPEFNFLTLVNYSRISVNSGIFTHLLREITMHQIIFVIQTMCFLLDFMQIHNIIGELNNIALKQLGSV